MSLMQIGHALGLPPGAQLRVEASGRIWTLRLIDAQHDRPAVELVFEEVNPPHRPIRLRGEFRLLLRSQPLSCDHVTLVDRRKPRLISPNRQGHVTVASQSPIEGEDGPSIRDRFVIAMTSNVAVMKDASNDE
jgi:hypothetical protein